jgi:enamine deaminase RidA (YjgF/YER057c/UK114 family)
MHDRIMVDNIYQELERGQPVGEHLSHVVKATGTTQVHVSGTVALDDDGNVVGEDDMEQQARKTIQNIGECLEEAGADPTDVVRMNIFSPDPVRYAEEGHKEIVDFFGEDNLPAGTLVGADLTSPKYLVEINVTAVTDG